jgi:hypothetical protein
MTGECPRHAHKADPPLGGAEAPTVIIGCVLQGQTGRHEATARLAYLCVLHHVRQRAHMPLSARCTRRRIRDTARSLAGRAGPPSQPEACSRRSSRAFGRDASWSSSCGDCRRGVRLGRGVRVEPDGPHTAPRCGRAAGADRNAIVTTTSADAPTGTAGPTEPAGHGPGGLTPHPKTGTEGIGLETNRRSGPAGGRTRASPSGSPSRPAHHLATSRSLPRWTKQRCRAAVTQSTGPCF